MKRQEEILSQAVKEQSQLYQPPEWRAGFISGAKWADEHPKEGLVNLKDVCDMNWQPIDRDENGFATIETLNVIVELHKDGVPIAMRCGDTYEILSPDHDIYGWYGEIERDTDYTHYLPIPIPKLEQ